MARFPGQRSSNGESQERPVSRHSSSSRTTETVGPADAVGRETTPVERLQRTLGNRVVRRMLASGGDSPPHVTTRGDEAERAASRAAAAMPPVSASRALGSEANAGANDSSRNGGVPLPPAVRDHFSEAFAHDFDDVRVHTDADAAAGAETVSAAAFTVGDDIAFARGTYRSDTARGGRLLAHELAHVVQNAEPGADSGRVARQEAPPGQGRKTDTGVPTGTPASPGQKPPSPTGTPQAAPPMEAGTEAAEEGREVADPLTRVRAAKKRVRDKKAFVPLVAGVYHANPNAGIEAWTATVWERLGLKGIPRESNDKRLQIEKFEWHVKRALAAEFRAISKTTKDKSFPQRVSTFLKGRLVGVPTVESVALVDLVWTEMLKCGRIDALPKRAQWAAKRAWGRVRERGIGQGYAKWAGETTSADALAAVGKTEKEDAVAALPNDTWVDTPAEMKAFLDTVAAKQGLKPAESEDDRVARNDLNDRANLLLTVAEVELIRSTLDAEWTAKLTPKVWLTARPSYLAALEVPIWHYYTEFIEEFTFLGRKTSEVYGLHQDIVPLLPAIEQTMLAEAGPRYSRVEDLPFRPKFYGFRFQPWREQPEKGKISYHGTGRAFDMKPAENPFFGKNEMTLVSLVSGTWVHELDLSRSELSRLADAQRPLLDRRRELRQQLADAGDAESRRDIEQELARTERGLQSVHGSERTKRLVAESSAVRRGLKTAERTKRLVEESSTVRRGLKKAERRLKANWPWFAAKTGLRGIDTSSLAAFLASLAKALSNPSKKGGNKQRPAADFSALVTFVEAHLKGERAALDAAEGAEKRLHEERVKRLAGLLDVLKNPKKRERLIRKKKRERGKRGRKGKKGTKGKKGKKDKKGTEGKKEKKPAAPGVAGLAEQGITNQPDWMIRAFTRHGWSWGGSWSSAKDAMHFDYMGALEGIRK